MSTPYKAVDKRAPHLSAHIVAPAKYGKTTVLTTLPKPLLLVSIDKSSESIFIDSIVPKERLEGIYIDEPTTYEDLLEAVTVKWKQGPDGKPYASLALDNMSYGMNDIIMPQILGKREKMELQDWGLYLIRGLTIARKAHELAMNPEGCHTVITYWESDKGGEEGMIAKKGPSVSGQLFDILPGIPNYALFLRIRRTNTKQGVVLERKLQTEADGLTPAGSRRKLDTFEDPDFEKIWEKVKPR